MKTAGQAEEDLSVRMFSGVFASISVRMFGGVFASACMLVGYCKHLPPILQGH